MFGEHETIPRVDRVPFGFPALANALMWQRSVIKWKQLIFWNNIDNDMLGLQMYYTFKDCLV